MGLAGGLLSDHDLLLVVSLSLLVEVRSDHYPCILVPFLVHTKCNNIVIFLLLLYIFSTYVFFYLSTYLVKKLAILYIYLFLTIKLDKSE